jgi:hypothetical protein
MTPAGPCRAARDSRFARDPAVTFLLVLAVFRFQPGRRQRGGKPGSHRRGLSSQALWRGRPASAICTAWSGLLQGPDSASGVHPFAALILPVSETALPAAINPPAVFQMILFARPILSRWPSSQFSNFYKGRRKFICRGSWALPTRSPPAGFCAGRAMLPWASPLPGLSASNSGYPLPGPSAPALKRRSAARASAILEPRRLPDPPYPICGGPGACLRFLRLPGRSPPLSRGHCI